jgi:hypothetical protein
VSTPQKRQRPCGEALRPLAHHAKVAKLAPTKAPVASTNSKGTKKAPSDTGSVHETDVQHRQRHFCQYGSEFCCRCNFLLHKAELAREQPWCTPRPTFLCGPWRLGCDVCRWKSSVQECEKHAGRRGCKTRASTFDRHEFVYNGPSHNMKTGSNTTPRMQGTEQLCSQQSVRRFGRQRDYPRIPSTQ